MDTFIQTKVFNPELIGKAVRIKGLDVDGEKWDRIFLVKDVNGERLTLVNSQGAEIDGLHIENFEMGWNAGLLELTVLEG